MGLDRTDMILAHFGFALFLAGVLITEASSVESDVRFAPNETRNIGGLDFRFKGVEHAKGPNYTADQGTLEVLRDGKVVTTLHPQKRQYTGGGMAQTKSDIDPGFEGFFNRALWSAPKPDLFELEEKTHNSPETVRNGPEPAPPEGE